MSMMEEYWEIFNMVKAGMGWDEEKTRLWMETKNMHLGNSMPITLILKGRYAKLKLFVESSLGENAVK